MMPIIQSPAPLAPGHSRLIIDVPEGSTAVSRVTLRPTPSNGSSNVIGISGRQRWTFNEELSLVCEATPCLLDMPPGNVLLSFPVLNSPSERSLPELVHIGATPTVFRRHLDLYTEGRSGVLWTGVTSLFLSTGGFIAGGILARREDRSRMRAGQITLGVSTLVFALAIWLIWKGVPTLTPGGSIHFPSE